MEHDSKYRLWIFVFEYVVPDLWRDIFANNLLMFIQINISYKDNDL